MTDSEVKKLIYVVKATYPRYYEKFTQADYENMLISWSMCLEEYTYAQASAGLKAFLKLDTKGYPPVVGQIIEQIQKLNPETEIMGALEAWQLVYKAICNSNYNSDSEFKKLPPLCQKVIGTPANLRSMANMEIDTVMGVEQSHFIRQYNENVKREKELMKVAPEMRVGIDQARELAERMISVKGESVS